jgi:hypothetical protein
MAVTTDTCKPTFVARCIVETEIVADSRAKRKERLGHASPPLKPRRDAVEQMR